jgi:WD40 repeat protein
MRTGGAESPGRAGPGTREGEIEPRFAFSPDGTRLVSAANDNTLKIWDVGTGRELATLHGHQYMVNCVTFSADGKTLISGGADEAVRFWDAQTTD